MRILVVNWQDIKNPQAGGAEIHLHEIFGRIAKLDGYSVDLLCSGFDGASATDHIDGINVYRIGSRFTFQFYARKGYNDLLELNRSKGLPEYDVVIEDLNKIPLFTTRWNPNRLVVLTHHLFGTTAFREASFPLAAATWLWEQPIPFMYEGVPFEAVSESTQEDLIERGVDPRQITVIYNGVDVNGLIPASNTRSTTPLFCYVGRIKKYKRIDLIIKAMADLQNTDAVLEIAGKGDDLPRLEQLVKQLGLMDRVRFLGYITEDEKRDLLRRTWASVLASPKEGWGISNLETAACGTPVIAANSPGIRESVVDGVTGYLVAGESVTAYARAMLRLINQPELVETLGGNARQFAETFTWERATRDTISHLITVVKGAATWKS